eukprot:10875884-Lingulodinium_polyedra.AAC.1
MMLCPGAPQTSRKGSKPATPLGAQASCARLLRTGRCTRTSSGSLSTTKWPGAAGGAKQPLPPSRTLG